MGSYVTFQGDMTIPREKLPEFNERVLTILGQGGMMGVERVELYGKRIALLTPPEPDEAGKVVCLQFCEVVCAIYVLYEFYAAGVAYRDASLLINAPTLAG